MADIAVFYIGIAIVALLVIAALVFFVKRDKTGKITPLAGLSFAFVVAGIAFGDDRLIGYGLMGAGVILAIADVIIKTRK
ncbi:MAG: hypothetical protein PHS02_02510 [Candidatus ainarchaeum sp.]|nr:hypothetical protein [Candidatus ainarchaeum sp.]